MNIKRCAILAAALVVLAADRLPAETIYDFTYISTRNSAHNNKAHMMNTGIQVEPGDVLHLAGTGSIHVGGPYYVWSNFDMGLVSPIHAPELIRGYQGVNTNYTAAPIPLADETVLFQQYRTSLDDHQDLVLSVIAQSAGYVYLGMFDNFFADNTGQHVFRITHVPAPEPATAILLLVPGLLLLRRRAK